MRFLFTSDDQHIYGSMPIRMPKYANRMPNRATQFCKSINPHTFL